MRLAQCFAWRGWQMRRMDPSVFPQGGTPSTCPAMASQPATPATPAEPEPSTSTPCWQVNDHISLRASAAHSTLPHNIRVVKTLRASPLVFTGVGYWNLRQRKGGCSLICRVGARGPARGGLPDGGVVGCGLRCCCAPGQAWPPTPPTHAGHNHQRQDRHQPGGENLGVQVSRRAVPCARWQAPAYMPPCPAAAALPPLPLGGTPPRAHRSRRVPAPPPPCPALPARTCRCRCPAWAPPCSPPSGGWGSRPGARACAWGWPWTTARPSCSRGRAWRLSGCESRCTSPGTGAWR